ncbi:MAG: NAD(P)H-dependent glycerol-3-phosphate dehydrogenase [Planctomycetota bacterium]|jgi:glycerol-3-phosphate dehydrogenase (NAD(P)+)
MHTVEEIIVIGSGNWGLALASLLAGSRPVRVWTIDQAMADDLNAHRSRPGEFYAHPIPDSITIEAKYASEFDQRRTLFILAVPSSALASVAAELGDRVADPLVVSVSKGYDARRLCTMSALIRQEIPGASVVVLTGPTIANEVADAKPTRAVLAGDDLMVLALVKEALANNVMSFEVSRNPAQHEICAALKGIVAIAVGMADGLELGANMQGILMTEGLREMAAVASFFDIPEPIAYGVSGAGDLITTCISPDSRNRRLGAALARGLTAEEALADVGMTVEGLAMSQTIETLWSLDVSIPLFHTVNGILNGERVDIREALTSVIRTL